MGKEAYFPVLVRAQQGRHGCHDLIMSLRSRCCQVGLSEDQQFKRQVNRNLGHFTKSVSDCSGRA